MDSVQRFKIARQAVTPLIYFTTPDYAAAIAKLSKIVNGDKAQFQWDIIRGLVPLNDAARNAVRDEIPDAVSGMPNPTQDPAGCLEFLSRSRNALPMMPADTVVYFLNAHRFLENPAVAQAVWNLREPFKSPRRTLVLMAPEVNLPVELQQDVLVIDDPLPTRAELATLAQDLYEGVRSKYPSIAEVKEYSPIVDGLVGLAAFSAEQTLAMCITSMADTVKAGKKNVQLDLKELWSRKKATINQTPGLRFYEGTETFDDIGGLETVKKFALDLRPGLIVIIEEIEKSIGSMPTTTGGDVGSDRLMVMLTEMENNGYYGIIAVGVPGAGKSLFAKAWANSIGAQAMNFDIGATSDSLVGSSEKKIRGAMKVIKYLASDNQRGTCFVASCNKLETVPPELRRRFRYGTFFWDLPDKDERDAIWKINTIKYDIKQQKKPNDEGWSGANIRDACEIAWRLNTTLLEASKYIVSASRQDPDGIERLRRAAHNRFLSASYPGTYKMSGADESQSSTRKREVQLA